MGSNKDYLETLPKKRMSAGCLFFDDDGRVLLVKPTYKETWETPVGIVEQGESPKAGCRREVLEELGLEREIGRLLLVSYNAASESKTESLVFVFEGGILNSTEIEQIKLASDELSEYSFFSRDKLPEELTSSLRKRIWTAWRHYEDGGDPYLENRS
jgi:ADP-ribose pyrophosphatase YjhB (NUDIX family)